MKKNIISISGNIKTVLIKKKCLSNKSIDNYIKSIGSFLTSNIINFEKNKGSLKDKNNRKIWQDMITNYNDIIFYR